MNSFSLLPTVSARARKRGVTLPELMIGMALFMGALSLSMTMLRLFRNSTSQLKLSQAQEEAQVVLYNMGRDVRNARKVDYVDGALLRLQMFDRRLGTTNPAMFDTVNIGTVTYQFVASAGGGFIERRAAFSAAGGVPALDQRSRLLNGLLKTPTPTEPLFAPYPSTQGPTTSFGAQIVFRLFSRTFGRDYVLTTDALVQSDVS